MKHRKFEKAYSDMLGHIYKTYGNNAPINMINCYVCDCGNITKTIDIDYGTTPMFYECEKCSNNARSTFYKDIAPDQKPTIQWYRPTLKKTKKMTPILQNHILSGGLISKKIQE